MNFTEEKLVITRRPIEAMALPDGWFEDFEETGLAQNASRRRFHSLKSPAAEIFIYDRGVPVDSISIRAFNELLAEKQKIVLPVKLQRVKNIIGNLSNPSVFKILIATIQRVSGKNVLIIEGRWSNNQDAYAMFMLEGPGSNFVVELHYQAIKEEFPKNLQAVKASVSSIKWQDN